MTLKEKYQIGEATWRKLRNLFFLMTCGFSLIFIPVAGAVVAFLNGDFSWTPVIAIMWFYPLLFIIPFWRLWFVRSKYTFLALLFYIVDSGLIFIIWLSACAYRLFGMNAVLIQNLLILIYAGALFSHFYNYWLKVWESHKSHNENVSLDLINGRFDFLNGFDMAENKVVKYSNPMLMKIALAMSPVGGAITLLLTKHGDRTTPIIIVWLLSIPVILGGYKLVIGPLHHIVKISYYEKLIGKPIINGLLDERECIPYRKQRSPKAKKKNETTA